MKKQKFIIVLVGILASILLSGICRGEVRAAKCGDAGLNAVNDSVYVACQKRGQGIPIGTLWISSSPQANDISSTINVDRSSGNVTVYLHGAVFYAREDALAKDIMFIKSNSPILRSWGNNTDFAPLQVVPGRQLIRKANVDPYVNDIQSSVTPINLNLDALIAEEVNSNYIEQNGRRIYTVNLQAFRCFQGVSQPDDRCWSSTSVLKVQMPVPISYVGQSRVASSMGMSETGFKNSSTEAEMLFKDDCEKGSGCNFVFRHYLKRYAGNKAIHYSIERQENGGDSVEIKNGTCDGDEKVYEDVVSGLRPGDMICQTLIFRPRGDSDSKVAKVKVCALAGGSLTSSLDMKAKKNNDTYSEEVWAKPGDKYNFQATYIPEAQEPYKLKPSKITYGDSDLYPKTINTGSGLWGLFNDYASEKNLSHWRNGFLFSEGACGNNLENRIKRYPVGYSEPVEVECSLKERKVEPTNVGKRINGVAETITASNNNEIREELATTPTQVSIQKYDSLDDGGVVIIESVLMGSLAVDINGGANNATSGTNVQIYTRNNTNAQKWVLEKDGKYYRIVNREKQNLVLDINGGISNNDKRVKNRANIQVYTKNLTCAQKWDIRANTYKNSQGDIVPDGTYTIVSACKGMDDTGKDVEMALDVSGGSAVSGTNLQVYQLSGSDSQKWNLVREQGELARVGVNPISSSATINVPYNFNNTIQIADDFNGGYSVRYSVTVGNRENGVVGGEYATLVRGAKHGLEWCEAKEDKTGIIQGDVEAVCANDELDRITNKEQDTFYPDSNNGENDRTVELRSELDKFNTGTVVCVRAWLFPASSGDDRKMKTDWSETIAANVSNYAYSSWHCFQVAGKSSYLQVWGGNVYSDNAISGRTDEKVFNNGNRYFGSFGELGVISNKGISGFASGAAWGYAGFNINEITVPSYENGNSGNGEYGGGSSSDIGRLSYQNVGNGNVGVGENRNRIKEFLEALGSKQQEDVSVGSRELQYGVASGSATYKKITDEDIYIISKDSGEITLSSNTINSNKTFIVRTGGNVVINGDIIYGQENASSLSRMPRMIIYAKNINIESNVKTIDALLIAEAKIDTCSNKQSGDCNQQLIINGAAIAKVFAANRTYGAGAGMQSIVPAEIINFDPSLYKLNSGSTSSSVESLRTIYTTELAPRY